MLAEPATRSTTRVGHLWLDDFRCLQGVDLELDPGLTVIHGANGQGKTSILEAIAWIARSHSFRGTTDGPLVNTVVASTFPPFVPPGGPVFRPSSTVPTVSTSPIGPEAFDPAWRLYLWDTTGGPTAVVAYDFATETIAPVPLDGLSGPIRAVVATPFGPVVDAGAVAAVTPAGDLT